MDHNNSRGRYFGSTNIDVAKQRRTAGPENHHPQYSKKDDIFFQEGKFADYVTLDVSDDEEAVGTRIEERTECNSTSSSDRQGEGGCIDELIKPIGIMFKCLATGSSPVIERACMSYVSEESNCCKWGISEVDASAGLCNCDCFPAFLFVFLFSFVFLYACVCEIEREREI